MNNINKLIRKIDLDISKLNYESILDFISECQEYEDLKVLKEQKLLFKIAMRTNNKKVFSIYLDQVKKVNKSQYNYEKNYIKFLNLTTEILNKITKDIEIVYEFTNMDNIYTNMYRLGKYNDINNMNAYELILDNIISDHELVNKNAKIDKKKVVLNLYKFTQKYKDKKFDYERLMALANSIILNMKYKVTDGYFNDRIGKEYFNKFMSLLYYYENIYNLNDDIAYGKYVVKKIIGKNIYLKFTNISYEKTRITSQRRENIRRELAKHNNRNSEFINYYGEVIKDVVIAQKMYYEKNEIGSFDTSIDEIINSVKNIINEEINYEDIILYLTGDKSVQASYLILIILISQWGVISKLKLKDDDDFIKYYYPINLDSIIKYIEQFDIKVKSEEIKKIFVEEVKSPNSYSLLYNPFIMLSNGELFGIHYLVERMDWSLFIRRKVIKGGDISRKYGTSIEKLVENVFEEYNWNIIARGYKLKVKNQIITDCDLITYKNGLLLLIQIKSSTKVKSPYDNWCVQNTIKKGVEQCKTCKKYINKEGIHIKDLLNNTGINIEGIEDIQTIVVTPNYHFNGISIQDIPIVNLGYLISLLNGAKVEIMKENFEVNEIAMAYLEENWKSSDFIRLLKKPFDWKVDLEEYEIEENKIKFRDINIIKPIIREKTIKFY